MVIFDRFLFVICKILHIFVIDYRATISGFFCNRLICSTLIVVSSCQLLGISHNPLSALRGALTLSHEKLMFGKKYISLLTAILLLVVFIPVELSAQDARLRTSWQTNDRHGICVDFRVNASDIDPNYRNNADVISRIDSLFTTLSQDSLVEIVSIEFCGTASPEGSAAVNHRLSRARMIALEDMVREHLDIPEGIVVHNDHYIAWHHLAELVESGEEFVHRERVLEIINTEYPEARDYRGQPIDGRIPELKKLDNGAVWNLLLSRYFVQMRNAWFIMVTVRKPLPEPEPIVEPEPEAEPEPVVEPEPAPIEEPKPEPVRPTPLMNVKINAVEAAALIANIGFEWRITPYLSLDVMGHYSPYDYFNEARKIRVFAIQPELRYWWGESLVKGHFIGVHVPVAGFNIQLDDKYRYQDPNRALWGVGVSYGYAMPLGKKQKWGVEFTIGVGYMNVVYDVYEGVHNGKRLRTEKFNYWGPTRLGINFSYRIDYTKKSNK